MSKSLPPPATGAGDLAAQLRQRRREGGTGRPGASRPSRTVPAPAVTVDVPMDRRSWYMPKASADALAKAAEDMHFDTRAPKHVVLAALVDVAIAHLDEVRARVDTRPAD